MPTYEDFTWTPEATLRSLAAGDRPWADYIATVVHFDIQGLVGAVEPYDGPFEDASPPRGNLHVITAIQPESDPESADSVGRLQVLDNELTAADVTFGYAFGSSADGSYGEASRAIFGFDDADARAMGRRFGQVAVFAWRGPRWSLLACAIDRETHQAWRWHQRE